MEQIFMNIIGDFVGGRFACRSFGVDMTQEFWRLRIFVNKRRQLGQVYVELSDVNWKGGWSNKKPWRKYLTSFWWEAVWTPRMKEVIDRLYTIKHEIFNNVSTVFLDKQLQCCTKSVENFVLRKYIR